MQRSLVDPLANFITAGIMGFGGSPGLSSGQMSNATAVGQSWVNQTPTGFALGGIIDRPTYALAGEAGTEVIMPVKRGRDGTMGVAASGGGPSNVTVEIRNESSQPAKVQSAQGSMTPEGFVVNVVLRDLRTNGPIRQTMRG